MNHYVTDPSLSHHGQHKLQAKHTFFWHRRIISFFARSKPLFHFPAELLLCHLQSNLSAESSLSVQHQPGGARPPGWGGLQFT